MNKEASLLIILMLLHPLLSRLRILASFPEFSRCMAAGENYACAKGEPGNIYRLP